MTWLIKLEQIILSKIKALFLNSKKLVDISEDTIADLEDKLIAEKQHVSDLAAKAHADAVVAAAKAQAEAETLVVAAKEAAERAAYHLANLPKIVTPTLDNTSTVSTGDVSPT